MRFLFFFELAFDEFNDVRMIYVQNHHLGCPSRFAATLDHAREGIKSLHEADRTGSNTAARERFLAASQLREIRAGAGTPFEQHAFRARQAHDRSEEHTSELQS